MMEWISVEDRLPESDFSVLVTWRASRKEIDKHRYINLDNFIGGAFIGDNPTRLPITHWMPLPEPPE